MRIRATVMVALTVCLSTLGTVYLANGVRTMLSPDFRGDLHARWREERYVLDGINPNDVASRHGKHLQTPGESHRVARHNLGGEPHLLPSGYPPWAFFTGLALVYPGDFNVTRWLFCTINIVALAGTLGCVYAHTRLLGRLEALFTASATFAMFAHAGTLRLGQYGIIVNAALMLTLIAHERKQRWLSSIGWVLAATKPNSSLLFFLSPIARRRWGAIAITTAYCMVGSAVVWLLTRVNPYEMTTQMLRQPMQHASDGDVGLLSICISIGMSHQIAAPALAAIGTVLAAWVAWRLRAAPQLATYAAAGVLGRLFLYHRQYDNLMLLFPFVALATIALQRRSPAMWIAFALVGTTLWAPLRLLNYTLPIRCALIAAWLGGLAVVLRNARLLDTHSMRAFKTNNRIPT